MANTSENKININELLKGNPKEPFSINLNINSESGSTEDLYNKIKDIFIKGLIIYSGDELENSININEIHFKHIDIMIKHMLSMGIDVKLKNYNPGTKDCLFKDLLYDIQNINNIDIKVLKDWNSDLIEKININLKITENNLSPLITYKNAIKRHFEANHFLKLSPPSVLHDYAMFIEDSINIDSVYVLYFDFAKRNNIEHIHTQIINVQ